jgi:hypothetical protein
LVFSDANNQSLLDMVIGSKDSGAAGSNLQYVMLPEENKVYQVDKSYPFLGKKPADWIEQQLLNVKASAIYQVTCYASNQQPLYTLQRKEKGSAPRFLEIPEGQKSAQTKIDLVFDALSPLSIEDVATKADAASGQPGSQQSAYQFEYQLYNGLVYTLWPIQKKTEKDGKEADEYRVNVQVTYRQPVPTEEQKEEKADDTNTETDEKHKTATPPPELAKQLNTKLSPWSYMISKWVYDSFVTDTQAFIQKDEKEDA